MKYSIGETAHLTGLSVHTLRYYESEQLVHPRRDAGRRRIYSTEDIAWLEFIQRLKATGMPIQEIRQYAQLRAEGASTLQQRLDMLLSHRDRVHEQIRALEQHEAKLEEKIAFYRSSIAGAGSALGGRQAPANDKNTMSK